ncbi:Alpha-(1,6)-fucosyltransferase, partial [Goodea atripinnis]
AQRLRAHPGRQSGWWIDGWTGTPQDIFGRCGGSMRPWAGSWRWITLVLLAWGTLLFYIGGHLVRDSEHPERSSRELSKILAKLERLKQQNEDLRRMAESLR